ncbi:hypothetical protein ACFQ3W_00380 [Paenibacillus puldeungensis]|uniref:ABC transporter permease n=1 Tax=Paenibacillus puldeungensis TaxID=696536 RepID=A0ABW3RRC2_9BACL
MLKLLKYDIKRNLDSFLSMMAILVIVQVLVSVIGKMRGWENAIIIGLSLILYIVAAVMITVAVCKTFATNLKAYHRRLLPVHPIWTIFSTLLLGFIAMIVFFTILGIHAFLYGQFISDFGSFSNMDWSGLIEPIFVGVWSYALTLLMIFMAITIGASVTINGRGAGWIGIIAFFIIQNGMNYVEYLLFGENKSTMVQFEFSSNGFKGSTGVAEKLDLFSWGSFLFELGCAGLMVYLISYLISKKVAI